VITEIDNTLNQTRSDKGQIISIQAKNNDYICQGCGSHNIIEDATVITCNDCHSKLLNEIDVNNDYFNISIISFTHDEYNLKITKSLLIPLMSQETDPSIENSDYFKSPDFLNTIISLNVDFTYDEKTGIINIITIHNDQNSRKNSF
jgi:DNA-directed RNA polymerase subunit RPC12/RpoP